MNVLVRWMKLSDRALGLDKAYPGDAGWDMYISRPLVIRPGEAKDARTDIAIAMESGFYAHIIGRSSTFRRHGVQVTEAIIDSGYRGELFVQVLNPTDEVKKIERGMRLAQLIFHRVPAVEWMEADELPHSERGQQAFGSSGE